MSRSATNPARVLQLLRRHGQLSRADIAQRSNLSEASVSRIVAELIRRELVEEEGVERSTGGRPAIRLRLCDRRYRSISVDVHAWETRIATGSLTGRLSDHEYIRTPSDPEETLDQIAGRVRKRMDASPELIYEGIGISVRGLVNTRLGVVEHGNDAAWTRIEVKRRLEKRLGVAVHLENNVRAAAFAEYHHGALDVREAHCLVFVKVDEGVGVSIMLDGELYYGQHMAAGEFGQMVIADRGGDETHDRPGCLEELAADGATSKRYADLTRFGRASSGDVTSRVKQICFQAMSGEAEAITALERTARYLGIGISNIVWGLDPDAIIIDGAISEAWPVVGPGIQKQFPDGREFLNFRNLLIRPSALGGQAASIGAAALPFRRLFSEAEHDQAA